MNEYVSCSLIPGVENDESLCAMLRDILDTNKLNL